MKPAAHDLADSYAYARRLCRRSGSSFHLSFCLLSTSQRRAMEVLYAYARVTDDLGDTGDAALRAERLMHWRQMVDQSLRPAAPHAGAPARDGQLPTGIIPALQREVHARDIPRRYLLEIVDGVLDDQTRKSIDCFENLERYCYLVAGTVGLCCTYIWGRLPAAGDPAANLLDQAAIRCGLAFQLTNILRDVREDAALGRVYLPAQLCRDYGIETQQIIGGQVDSAGFECVVQLLCDRALGAYRDGWQVHDSIHRSGRRMFSLIWNTYRDLLLRIQDDATAILARRISLPIHQRVRLAARHFARIH